MAMRTIVFILFITATIMSFAADSKSLIPFQGRITDQNGVQYTEGRYTVVFNLYDAPVGGMSLWSERHESISPVNGMITVILGSISDLSGQDFSKTRYLGITIDADGNANTPDPEMVPRQMIIPCFFTKESEKLNGADWSSILSSGAIDPRTGYISGARIADKSITADKLADNCVTTEKIKDSSITSAKIANNSILPEHLSSATLNDLSSAFIPAGAVVAYAGSVANPPLGWLPCDGRVVSSLQYPKLFAAIGTTWGKEDNISENGATFFKLPDLRDRVLWGADQNALGTYVGAGIPNIEGTVTGFTTHGLSHSGAFSANGSSADNLTGSGSSWYRQGFTFSASSSSTVYGASDTVQPPAAAVNFIIKVESVF